jgi:6-phosphofructokinase
LKTDGRDWLKYVVYLDAVSGILQKGGTILGTSRTNPYNVEDGERKVLENAKR